jgi:DNA-binding protein H-NS
MASESKTSAAEVIRLLEGLTVPDLDRVIAEAERQREARKETGRRELVEEFKARAAAMGLSLEALLGNGARPSRPQGKARPGRRGSSASPAAAKYRDPETGETWSGRGRVPRWLKAAERRGRKREEFAVGG